MDYFDVEDTQQLCWICGQFTALDGCHVKDKKEFTDEQMQDNFDRNRNIIILCKAHHKLFDVKKEIGIVKLNDDNYHFTRINHCNNGICATESLEPMINLFFRDLGDEDADVIDLVYVKWKNDRLSDGGHRQFSEQKFGTHNWKMCNNPNES